MTQDRAHNYSVERRLGRWFVFCSTCGERERLRRGTWLPGWGCPGAPTARPKAQRTGRCA